MDDSIEKGDVTDGATGIDMLFADVPELTESWTKAKVLLKEFPPVSWPVWRACKFIFGPGVRANVPPAGMLMGANKILGALYQHEQLGAGEQMLSLSQVTSNVDSSIVGSTLVMHNICRRLATAGARSIWSTMLDDALVRARIGGQLGAGSPELTAGRGMLAGFSGRVGMVILIATGNHQQASQSLQLLAAGGELDRVGLEVYGIDPNHVTAQVLVLSGLGQDPAIGVLAFGNPRFKLAKAEQSLWVSAMRIIEATRLSKFSKVEPSDWENFGISSEEDKEDLRKKAKAFSRKGHKLDFLL